MSNYTSAQSVKSFCEEKGFVQFNKAVNSNVNGRLFITFIDANNKAENIYFSKEAEKVVSEKQAIVPGFFKPFNIREVLNADGEARTKISLVGESTRGDVSELF